MDHGAPRHGAARDAGLLAGALIAFLQAMTLFGLPAILALPAGFHTLTTKIWSLFQYPPKLELAAAASLPLLLVTVLLLRGESLCSVAAAMRSSAGGRGGRAWSRLGRWRWAALARGVPGARSIRCSCLTGRWSTRHSPGWPRNSDGSTISHLHNVRFVFVELSATGLAFGNT